MILIKSNLKAYWKFDYIFHLQKNYLSLKILTKNSPKTYLKNYYKIHYILKNYLNLMISEMPQIVLKLIVDKFAFDISIFVIVFKLENIFNMLVN